MYFLFNMYILKKKNSNKTVEDFKLVLKRLSLLKIKA